jgi:hypothetical protein
MKKIIVYLLVVTASFIHQARASVLTVIGPCQSKPIFQSQSIVHGQTTLGDFTLSVLNSAHVPFVGSREGIKSIHNSPTGDAALEVLSDSSMRSYGWCVSVNGKQPSQMPDEVMINNPNSQIVWFYAYSTYVKGQWVNFCIPSYQLKSPYVCSK